MARELGALHAKITGDSSSLQQAAKRAAFEMNKLDAKQREAAQTAKASADAYRSSEEALNKLRRSMNPLYAASKKYESQLKTLHAQMEAGKISEAQLWAMSDKLSASFLTAGGSAQTFNKQLRSSRFATGNLAAQFNDIGVMLASGQSPFTLAIQQGTQVSQVLNMMGGKAEILGSLKAAFLSFINPISLVTVGLIAGGAALVQWGVKALGAGDETKKFSDKVVEARTKVASLNEEIRQMQWGVDAEELVLMDDLLNKQREYNELLKQRNAADVEGYAFYDQKLQAAGKELSATKALLEELRTARSEKERLVDLAAEQGKLLEAEVQAINDANKAQAELKLLTSQVSVQANILQNNISGANDEMIGLFQRTKDMKEELGTAAYEALRLAGVDMASGIDAAQAAAARLAAQLGVALGKAIALQATFAAEDTVMSQPVVSGPATDRFGVKDLKRMGYTDEYLKAIGKISVSAGGGGRGGGGGGGKSEADKLREETEKKLEAMRDGFKSEMELEMEQYAERQAVLKSALEQKLLTQKEYEELSKQSAKEHADAVIAIERLRAQQVRDAYSGALGDLASLMQSGNKNLFKIGKAAALSQAIVDGYGAAVSAWDKGMKVGGPPVAAAFTAASLAKTGSLIASIASQNFGGNGSGTKGGTGGVTTPAGTSSPETRTISEIRFMGSLGASGATLVDIINEEYDRGNYIKATIG